MTHSRIRKESSVAAMYLLIKLMVQRDFPGGPVAKTVLSVQGAWVPSLVGELRSYMPHSMVKRFK